MYRQQIPKINKKIEETGKVIITMGCSFVQGQGAVNDELYTDYTWHFERLGVPLELRPTKEQRKEILAKYPIVEPGFQDKLDFTFMEYSNAFGEVLADKYFKGEYAHINLGMRGNGNRGTIKELYFHPEVKWDLVKETIVIFAPSGLERFDFAYDNWMDHAHWRCIWPHYKDIPKGPRHTLWKGYAEHIFSDKHEVLEQLSNVQELKTWCENKNAKLIITPAFDKRYTREYFKECLMKKYERNMEGEIIDVKKVVNEPYIDSLVELWPWDNMFYPDNYETFVDLVVNQEENPEYFFNYLGKASPNLWVTSCAHPSAKGHDLFAKKLYEFITKQ